jgi:hypothetical protein
MAVPPAFDGTGQDPVQIIDARDPDVNFTWIPADFLQAHEIRPWSQMTTWFGEGAVLSETSNARAVAGVPADQERALLQAWHAARG